MYTDSANEAPRSKLRSMFKFTKSSTCRAVAWQGFLVAWNVLYGVPLLMHSLLYSNQLDHNPQKYGTSADGEYLPLASAPFRETLLYLAQIPFLLILAVFRFLILVPLSLLHPRWRQRLLARATLAATSNKNPMHLWLDAKVES